MLPANTTGIGLFYLNESLITLCAMQFLYILIPAIYIRYLSKEGELRGIRICISSSLFYK